MQRRWQDYVGLVLGVLLFLSPWVLGYSGMAAAAGSAWVIGVATVVLFAVALYKPDDQWEEWVNLALAVVLLIAPFAMGFTAVLAAAYTHWILGVLIGADAIWALFDVRSKARGTA